MAIDHIGDGAHRARELAEEMRSSYLDYAMSVIVGRALPDVRDGLKPVHRRVLYAMQQLGLQPNRPYVKCAKVVGDVHGRLPPARRHRDLRHARAPGAALLLALPARRRPGQLRQRRRLRRGRHALHRVPARRRMATEMLRDLDEDTVDFEPNYDERADDAGRSCPRASRTCSCNGSLGHRRRHGDEHPAAQPAAR